RRSAAQIVFSDNVDAGYPDTPLPTRFWEAASSPSCVFFDRTCESWLRSGFNSVPDDLLTLAVVDGPDDLHEKVKTLRGNSRAWRKHVDLQLSMTKGFDPFVDWRMAEWV
ncbi:MAG: hypothetical protein KKD77_23160, partial [Gammaproteobacteria bacterium]|nr:hypothetical protein [Gammaproteobacteria bacterium]